MAVHMELRSVVSSPVALAFRPSSRTNLVRVITLVSKAPLSDIVSRATVQYVQVQVDRTAECEPGARVRGAFKGGVWAGKPIRRGIYTHLVRQDIGLIKVQRL